MPILNWPAPDTQKHVRGQIQTRHDRIDEQPEHASRSQQEHFKYTICDKSPNPGNRETGLVVIPDPHKPAVKIITATWRDEQ